MNWGKILNRLIVVFIIVNVVLGIMNLERKVMNYTLSKERVASLQNVLTQRDIYVNTVLPKLFTPKTKASIQKIVMSAAIREEVSKAIFGKDLEGVSITTANISDSTSEKKRIYKKENKLITFNEDTIFYRNQSVKDAIVSLKKAEKTIQLFLKDISHPKSNGVTRNKHLVYEQKDGKTILTYYTIFEGYAVFDSYIRFTVGKDSVQSMDIHLGEVKLLENKKTKQPIYPVDKVLFGLDDYLVTKTPIFITDIMLGYKMIGGESMDILEEELIPVYKITIQGLQEPVIVNAYTNKIIN